jgi:hypothetical protein
MASYDKDENALVVLLMPVIIRLNEGRWDWRRVRHSALAWSIAVAQAVTLVSACFLTFGLVIAVNGGWPGGWRDVPIGVLIGASAGVVVGWPVAVVGARLRIGLGIASQVAIPRRCT